MKLDSLLACVSPLLLAACASAPPLPPGNAIGEPIRSGDVVAFAVVDADPEPWFDRELLVEATTTAVCQNAGCWMQVEDEGRTAMVRWETGCGGKYAFPKDLAGRRVLIQGTFYPKTLTEADVEHLQEEAGGGIEVEQEGYEFNASAILVLDEAGG